jgi:hypothetical protein
LRLAERFTSAFDYLSRRRTAYVHTFRVNAFGPEVLQDLAKFCRAHETTFHPDARAHAVAEGRREVWLRIQKHLQLTDDELFSLYGTGQPKIAPTTEED